LGFAGQLSEATTGLVYMRARWYDPASGHFMTTDPASAGNLYAYGADNPIVFTDPSGLMAEDDSVSVIVIPDDDTGGMCNPSDCAGAGPGAGGPGGGGSGAGGSGLGGIVRAAASAGGAGVVLIGQQGEAAVREIEDIGPKVQFEVNGVTRIADGLNRQAGVITEVKNVSYQAWTQQIQDYIDYSQQEGLLFNLWIRASSVGRLAVKLQAAVNDGRVNLRTFDWP
jgi:RHS repeat-associated protein